jgi:hypothetical protein
MKQTNVIQADQKLPYNPPKTEVYEMEVESVILSASVGANRTDYGAPNSGDGWSQD